MMANFEEHAKTNYKNRWLYFTVHEDEYEDSDELGSFYVEIFDRQGKDVANLSPFATRQKASSAAIAYIQEREAKSREISPEL